MTQAIAENPVVSKMNIDDQAVKLRFAAIEEKAKDTRTPAEVAFWEEYKNLVNQRKQVLAGNAAKRLNRVFGVFATDKVTDTGGLALIFMQAASKITVNKLKALNKARAKDKKANISGDADIMLDEYGSTLKTVISDDLPAVIDAMKDMAETIREAITTESANRNRIFALMQISATKGGAFTAAARQCHNES